MKSGPFLRSLVCSAIFLAMLILFAGCARSPAGSSTTNVRALNFQINFNGPINDNYYYFVAFDNQGGATGPLPVFQNPEVPSADDWVTGSANYYVMYHQRQFTVFRIDSLHPLQSTPIGSPVREIIPDPGAQTLNFTVDMSMIQAAGTSLDFNIITLNQLPPQGRLLDALGPLGSDFVNIDITSNRTFRNTDTSRPESTGDVLNQNIGIQPPSDQTNPLDISDWTVSVELP